MRFIHSLVFLLITFSVTAQEKKNVGAFYIDTPINIDGILDEKPYSIATPATDFLQLMPFNGRPAQQPSSVYILYDQTAIYVGGMLYDSAPDSIFNFFSERDNIGPSDYFGVYFDPYNQGQTAYGFFLTPAGVQTDIKAIKAGEEDNEDSSWDAVWQSKTRVTDKGWVVEMKIPYSALRFPENGSGTWGLNMFRNIKRYSSNSSWNFVHRQTAGFIHQQGELSGIKDIKPPVRLSISPYAAAYSEFSGGESKPEFTYKGGLDLKYGISESFTLDMMLVPDFGQIQSDDKRLNLSPYELYYSEKRQFFTEGTELFDRGEVFYSRRIGAAPKLSYKAYDALEVNEVVDYNPTETQLLNATKISGRTSGGWGLGLLNSMTLPSYAILKDTVSGDERRVMVQPFTNYNVAVADRSLKNNSYISLINTNMHMAGNPLSANVTATEFQLRNRKKTFAIGGKGGLSVRNNGENQTGYFAQLRADKNSGKLQYGISQEIVSDKFNPNDLGYLRRNNEVNTSAYLFYGIIEPFGIFRDMGGALFAEHNRMYKPSSVSESQVGISFNTTLMSNYGFEANFEFQGTSHDYYEPRVAGRYFTEPYELTLGFWSFTDNRKPIRFSYGIEVSRQPETDKRSMEVDFTANYRLGRHLQLRYSLGLENEFNDKGFVDKTEDEMIIYFARRDIKTLQNIFESSYAINNKAGINLRVRHYWSGAMNKQYYQLLGDGSLENDPFYLQNQDENYNAFNIDLVYRWIFAPGSELSVAWKNSIYKSGDLVIDSYWHNLGDTWESDQINSFSIKVLYYIDYNSLRKKK